MFAIRPATLRRFAAGLSANRSYPSTPKARQLNGAKSPFPSLTFVRLRVRCHGLHEHKISKAVC